MISTTPAPAKGIKFRKKGKRENPPLTNGPYGYILKASQLSSQIEETYQKLLNKKLHIDIREHDKFLDYLVLRSRGKPDRFVWVYENFSFEDYNQEKFMGNADAFAQPSKNSIHLHEDNLPGILLSFGHELGHIFTRKCHFPSHEEAKAYAFEYAWGKTIIRNNIDGLGKKMTEVIKSGFPSLNNRPTAVSFSEEHSKGLAFVQEEISKGKDPMNLYWNLSAETYKKF